MNTDITEQKIKQILKERKVVEEANIENLKEQIPAASNNIINRLFELIVQEGEKLPISLTPEISLSYYDSRIYFRIIKRGSTNFIESSGSINLNELYPSITLQSLFTFSNKEDNKIFLKRSIREFVCKELAKTVLKTLKKQGFTVKEIKPEDKFETPSEITISILK